MLQQITLSLKNLQFYIKIMKINTLIAFAVFFTACTGGNKQAIPNLKNGMNAPQVVNYAVLNDTLIKEVIQITGTIQAEEQVDLHTEMSGKVTKIFFKEGVIVKQGDLILKLNEDELRAQSNRAYARLKLAEEQEYRQRILLKKEAISQQEYDIVNTDLLSMKAESELLKAQLAKTELRAPFNGKLGLRMISLGDYISPSTIITKLVKDDNLKITFSIPEKYASHMKSNAEIIFSTDGDLNKNKAVVYAMDPSIDENTRTLNVRAIAKNTGSLIPGSFCKVELEMKEINKAILIPNEAVIPILKGKKVFVVKNGIAAEVLIKTGIRSDKYIQVTEGLATGDTLITSGMMSLKDGSALKLK